jgi:hypothetical protein
MRPAAVLATLLMVTMAAGPIPSASAQVPGQIYPEPVRLPAPLGVGPLAVAEDWDGDGTLDLVFSGTTVNVMTGNGDLSFEDPVELVSSPGFHYLGSAEVNGDGTQDTIAGIPSFEPTTDLVLVALGDGLGEYALSLGHPYSDVLLRDLDQDGRKDVVAAHVVEGGPHLTTLMSGTTWFAPPLAIELPGEYHRLLVACLIDTDALPELIAYTPGVIGFAVYRGDGGGDFAQYQTIVTENPVATVLTGDIDGDGREDALAIEAESNLVKSYFASNFGGLITNFVPYDPFPVGNPTTVAGSLRDVDGDGLLDLITASSFSSGLSQVDTHRGLGDGTFGRLGAVETSGETWLFGADLDGDEAGELVTWDLLPEPGLTIRRGREGGHYWATWTSGPVVGDPPGSASAAFTADLDGVGWRDLVRVDSTTVDVAVDVALVDDMGLVAPPERTIHTLPSEVTFSLVFDHQGDGDLDILLYSDDHSELYLIEQTPDGLSATTTSFAIPSLSGIIGFLEAHDVNGDGRPDLLFTTLDQFITLLADGSGGFGPPVESSHPETWFQLAAVEDFNFDGNLDILAIEWFSLIQGASLKTGFWRGQSDGSFLAGQEQLFDQAYEVGVVADLDGDGRSDLLLGASIDDPLVFNTSSFEEAAVYAIDSSGLATLRVEQDLSASDGPDPIHPDFMAADLDLNGTTDLISTGSTWLWPGRGDGTFAGPIKLEHSSTIDEIVDLSGDGLLDLLDRANFTTPRFNALVHTGGPWFDAGPGLAGGGGIPALSVGGFPAATVPIRIRLEQAAPAAPLGLVFGLQAVNLPFKGGVMVPATALPDGLVTWLATTGDGSLELSAPWPSGIPAGQGIWVQCWIVDALAPAGASASNAMTTLSR